jgi:pimeloyl-ACP methyl ester carboxylesterase
VILAVPVASPHEVEALSHVADEVVSVETPTWLSSIGQWYADFSQTSDREVIDLLARAGGPRAVPSPESPAAGRTARRDHDGDVVVKAGAVQLTGRLTVPPAPIGLVVFAHGSGSSRLSPRNRYVADVLHEAYLGTLLFDLLTTAEESYRRNVFDIELLTTRLLDVVAWLRGRPEGARAPVGLFGASTGAAAALSAAAEPSAGIAAVVSRGGRPDLAGDRLARVEAPTLLIVGALDEVVLDLNRAAQARLRGLSRLAVVPGASHLFEEPGTLQIAAELARDWFREHLGGGRPRS